MQLTKQNIKDLKDKKYRKQNKLFFVEGEKFCADILRLKQEILLTLTTNKELKGYPNTCVVNEQILSSLATTKTNQNILCVCKIKEFDISSVGNSLVLDTVQDPGNVGTLIRSAMAFGFDDIYLINSADPYSEKVIRSSAGTALFARLHIVDFEQFNANKQKIAQNFLVADMFGEPLGKIRLPKNKIAVIIGNEGNGVSQQFIALANTKISIPMSSKVESLNAGVAGSIIMQKISEVKNVRS